jgi:tetratricopeptide (TPR) repeat protein
MDIGTTLRRLRLERSMTQSELAAPSYTHAFISSIESGRRRPSDDAVRHFASKLGVTEETLRTGRSPELEVRLEMELAEARLALSDNDADGTGPRLMAIATEAEGYGLERLQCGAWAALGLLRERDGRPEDALTCYQTAEELAGDLPAARADCIAGRARCFQAMGDLGYAIFLLQSMLGELQREGLNDPDALVRLHSSLVDAYLDAGLPRQAAESARVLQSIASRVEDPLRLAQMHMNVARLHAQSGHIDQARDALRRAEEAYRHLGLRAELGGTHLAYGYVESRSGNLEQARRELETARAIFEETRDDKDLTRTLNELGRVARLQGRLEDAASLLQHSILLLEGSDTLILGWAFRELALVQGPTDPVAAEKSLRASIDYFERGEQPVELAISYRELGDLVRAHGRSAEACELYRVGLDALEPTV